MSDTLTRKELRDGIKTKIEEADVLFRAVVALYFNILGPQIDELKKAGHSATAFDLEYYYNDFVQRYHSFCSINAALGRFASTKRLKGVCNTWDTALTHLAEKPAFFTQLANPEKEIHLRTAIAVSLGLLETTEEQINSIVSEHIAEIREVDPSILSTLARISTLKQFEKRKYASESFEELNTLHTRLSYILREAKDMHMTLAQRFVK